MVFSSPIFLFGFLPAVLLLYFVAPLRARNAVLLAASLFFYAWGEPAFVVLMGVSIVANYAAGLAIERGRGTAGARRALAAGVAANLLLLGFFKYAGFVAETAAPLLRLAGLDPGGWDPPRLPIGISFFTFQALSYLVDLHRGQAAVQRRLLDLALYIALFPQLIAGPIVRYAHLARQLRERTIGAGDFAEGIRRFVIGLAKKLLIANTLAVPADAIFALEPERLAPAVAWLGVACYGLQIYFDFSGYSDMAIGLGRMFGFRFLENFEYPYIAASVREFWRRWHISLSTWFRDYLYIPLGGGRVSPLRVHRNLLVVFLLCGLWHGASWNFAAWGLLHGAFIVLERSPAGALLGRMPRSLGHLYCLLVVFLAWVPFRAEDLGHALSFYAALAGQVELAGAVPLARFLPTDVLLALALGAVGATPWLSLRANRLLEARPHAHGLAAVELGLLALVFAAALLKLASGTHNPFIYFRF